MRQRKQRSDLSQFAVYEPCQRTLDDFKCNKIIMMMMMKVTEILCIRNSLLFCQTRFIAGFHGHVENNRFDSFVYINTQYSRFSSHTHIKLKKKSKTKNMSVLSNTMFRFSRFRTTDIHRRTIDSVNNQASKLFFLINVQCLLVYFKNILIFI